jgi:hypothetical protein
MIRRVIDKKFRNDLRCPRYYIQFVSDLSVKTKMLDCYASIDIASHRKNYIASTSPCEALYLYGEAGLYPFRGLMDLMTIKTNPDLFETFSYRNRIPSFLKRKFSELIEKG